MAENRLSTSIKTIFAGGLSSAAITRKNDLYLWGANFSGNLPVIDETTTTDSIYTTTKFDTQQINGKIVVSVALSSYHSLFLTSDGQVYSCGIGRGGRLGLGDTNNHYNELILITCLNDIKGISSSDGHSAAYNSKALYTWGEGCNGRLGHGIVSAMDRSFVDIMIPKHVKYVEGV